MFDNCEYKEQHEHLNRLVLNSANVTRVKFIHAVTNYHELHHLIANYTSNNVKFDKKNIEFYLIVDQTLGTVR